MSEHDVRIFDSAGSLRVFAAELITARIIEASTRSHPFSLVLSGGSTPLPVYGEVVHLTRSMNVTWKNAHLFWGDERCVPPDDARSNYGMARDALLAKITLPKSSVHRIRGELPPEEGAAQYEQDLEHFAGSHRIPSFDLFLLGLGADGHTASLFPSSPALFEKKRLVTHTEKDSLMRITLTLRAINRSKEVLFIVTGKDKAYAVSRVLNGPFSPVLFPAQGVRPSSGIVHWFLDPEAASRL